MWFKSDLIQGLKVMRNPVMKKPEKTAAFSRIDEDLYLAVSQVRIEE